MVVMVLSGIGWLFALPLVSIVLEEWTLYDEPGDAAIGMLVVGPIMLVVSLALLALAGVLSIFSRRLPLVARVLSLVLPAAGVAAAAAILYRALS